MQGIASIATGAKCRHALAALHAQAKQQAMRIVLQRPTAPPAMVVSNLLQLVASQRFVVKERVEEYHFVIMMIL